MSRIDYTSRHSPRRNSPPLSKYRFARSRSRDRFISSRRSPLSNSFINRNRIPVHQRLSDQRSRSIEKRLTYPSKHEIEKRASFRPRSRSPRRRTRRSRSRSTSRHRSRSRSRRRSRLQSRSRSKDRSEDRSKFTFFTTTNESNELLINKSEDGFLREQFNLNNDLTHYGFMPQQSQSTLIDKPSILETKLPLLDKPPMIIYDAQFNDDHLFYDNQLNQIAQMKQLNNPLNNLYLNQASHIPITDNEFRNTNTPNISRALRERLDVVHPPLPPVSSSSTNALLETPGYMSHVASTNAFNNNCNNRSLNSPLGLNGGVTNTHQNNNHTHHQLTNSNMNNVIGANLLDNDFYNHNSTQDIDLRSSNSTNLVYKDSLLGDGPSDHQSTISQTQTSHQHASHQQSNQSRPSSQPHFNAHKNSDVNNRSILNDVHHSDSNEKCMFNHLGCAISTRKDMISKHEIECLYNPRNVKAFCNKCKLSVCPEHDCILELRSELNQTRTKTNWCQNTIKLTSASLLNNDFDHQVISVHYASESKDIVKQIKISKVDRMDFILKQAVDLVFTKESLARLNKTERDFQLVCSGLYAFPLEQSFCKSTKLQLPEQDNHLHVILIEKRITVRATVKRLFYQNQHIIVPVPTSVPFQIDPVRRICDLKEIISEKIPVIQWDKHRMTIGGKEFKDFQILHSIGLCNGDRIEIEAY